MSDRPRKTVLVTGAAGVVGRAFLAALDDSVDAIALVRSTPIDDPNVECVKGDIGKPKLGLDAARYDELVQRIDCVVHSAAISNWSETPERILEANVNGTERMLELAADAEAGFMFVGTAQERAPGAKQEMVEKSVVARAMDTYRRSKNLADEVVANSDVPHITVKPSLVIGDSKTGWIAKFQAIHTLTGYLIRREIPVIPFQPDTPFDCINQDVMAEAMAELIHHPFDGAIHYLTLGDDAATITEIMDWGFEFADEIGMQVDGSEIRFVEPDVIDRLWRPVFMPAFSLRQRRRIERALEWEAFINQRSKLQSSLPELRERYGVCHLPDLKEAYIATLRYWAQKSGSLRRLERLGQISPRELADV